jgi:hypothetical protein
MDLKFFKIALVATMGIIGVALTIFILRSYVTPNFASNLGLVPGSDPKPYGKNPAKKPAKNPGYSYAKPSQRIKGFKYDGYDGPHHLLSITCRSLIISRKKLGFVRFGLMKEAILTNGHFKFFQITGTNTDTGLKESVGDKESIGGKGNADFKGNAGVLESKGVKATGTAQSANIEGAGIDGTAIKKAMGLMISKDSKQVSGFKGVVSIIVKPVKIELYAKKLPVMSISAMSAVIQPVKGKIIFKKRVVVISNKRKLMLDRLELNPENGLLTGTNYVLYASGVQKAVGKHITTDFGLEKGFE